MVLGNFVLKEATGIKNKDKEKHCKAIQTILIIHKLRINYIQKSDRER